VVGLVFGVPLTRAVEFKAVLQRGNRVQVPKLVRWEFKLESSQVLKVRVGPVGAHGQKEQFFGRMNSDGRMTVPKLPLDLLQNRCNGGKSLVNYVLEVQLEPSGCVST
jgi:hypothetical protein